MTHLTRIFTHEDVRALLDTERAVAAVEQAFRAHGEARALMPPKLYLDLEDVPGDFRAMPARAGDDAGLKWVNAHPHNPARHGIPSVLGVYILSDPQTALPLAVMDATVLTALRTGAAAAVATRHLARAGARTLGVIGAGAQCAPMVDAIRVVRDDLELVVADRDDERARAAAAALGGRAGTVEEAAGCDVVCTATPTRTPIVRRAWLRPGAHVNAMGADGPGKQQLDDDVVGDARVFLDDREQGLHSGEVNVPLHAGRFSPDDVAATLGEVVAGRATGRADDDELTLFDSTGLAVQDLFCARAVYAAGVEGGVGLEVALVPAS
jgi:ornithine cyclodeaminase/alanine dehydrogenase